MSCVRLAGVLAIVVTLGSTGQAAAEGGEVRMDHARTFLVLRIAEALELSDDKALQISRIFKEAGERRVAIQAERAAMAPQLESAIASSDEGAINDLVAKAREIDRKLLLVVSDSFGEVDSVLTAVERGKLALLMPQIQDQLRRGGRRGFRDGRRRGEAADPRREGRGTSEGP